MKVNRELCIACGSCYSVCPEVYESDDEGKSKIVAKYLKTQSEKYSIGEVGEDLKKCAKEGAEVCGVEAIEIS
ncbi:MAG: ferredoxin [Candidatus Odinarchaeum yellowstonii]|uniref:Ferredoxin n=1 Tax=Odinarchaeota yellowstonii (strain LCB_4) TaxID=1841599 RepID=A0AAF0D1C1_ODILC|nr:MAG: ferredoxin [Candidatus Odinarchaeum yellowstonii]